FRQLAVCNLDCRTNPSLILANTAHTAIEILATVNISVFVDIGFCIIVSEPAKNILLQLLFRIVNIPVFKIDDYFGMSGHIFRYDLKCFLGNFIPIKSTLIMCTTDIFMLFGIKELVALSFYTSGNLLTMYFKV